MTTKIRNVLSVAAASRKIGCVFFIDRKPYHWRICPKAAKSPSDAYECTSEWVMYYEPQLLITERIPENSRKGANTRALIKAVCKAAQDSDVRWVLVDRVQPYQNKYEEARALAQRYPELTPSIPKKREEWEAEPRQTILFEALSMGLLVAD